MKKRLSLGVLFLLVGITAILAATGQDRSANGNIRQRFVGAWRLAWLEDQVSDGKIHRADSTGQLVFTSDGHISVQVMYRNPQPDSKSDANAAPVQYAGSAPTLPCGVAQINMQLPANAPAGQYAIDLTAQMASSAATNSVSSTIVVK